MSWKRRATDQSQTGPYTSDTHSLDVALPDETAADTRGGGELPDFPNSICSSTENEPLLCRLIVRRSDADEQLWWLGASKLGTPNCVGPMALLWLFRAPRDDRRGRPLGGKATHQPSPESFK